MDYKLHHFNATEICTHVQTLCIMQAPSSAQLYDILQLLDKCVFKEMELDGIL